MPESPIPPPAKQDFGLWALLLLPFLALLLAAAGNERASWPDLLPRESTLLMQAGSLLEDHDLVYERLDFDRLLLAWRGNPPDLNLATGSDGRKITFQYPFVYALYLAPFLAIAPERGIACANILLLLLATCVAGRTLHRRLGGASPLLLGLWLFGSAAFATVFRADGDAFVLALSLLAGSAVLAAEPAEQGRGRRLMFGAGLLLGPVILAGPTALLLLALLVYSVAGEARRRLAPPLLLGAAAGMVFLMLVQWWNGGGLYFFATSTFNFTPATGYPAVDFPTGDWASEVQKLRALNWNAAPKLSLGFEPRLLLWNVWYFFAGASHGLIPYLLPLLLLLALARSRALLLVTALWVLSLLVLQPFNFWGGPGGLGNRLLLPLYGAAIVCLPALRGKWAAGPGRTKLAGAAILVLVAPFLAGLWASPGSWPFARAAYQQQTAWARGLLPHETSQQFLPGGTVAELNGIFVAALDENSWVEKQQNRLGMQGGQATFLVCSGTALSALVFEMGEDAPSEVSFQGGELAESILRPEGGIGFRIEPRLWRRHPLFFSPLPLYIYRIEIGLPAGARGDTFFRLTPEWPAGEDR